MVSVRQLVGDCLCLDFVQGIGKKSKSIVQLSWVPLLPSPGFSFTQVYVRLIELSKRKIDRE